MDPTGTDPATVSLHGLMDLTGRTAIVTGASMGIGLGIARRLHEAGAAVVMADLAPEAAAAAVDAMNAARAGSAIAVRADVADEGDVRRMVEVATAHLGDVHILVNNAGIYPSRPLRDLDAATFRRVLDVNLLGLFLCTRAVADHMVERRIAGRMVNVTSIDALHPSMAGLAHYDASKHGAWGFTKNVALELAPHGIVVNAVAPGAIRTPGLGDVGGEALERFEALIPMGRLGEPDEIGRATVFLASDLAGYITGSQLVVDGGRLLA